MVERFFFWLVIVFVSQGCSYLVDGVVVVFKVVESLEEPLLKSSG